LSYVVKIAAHGPTDQMHSLGCFIEGFLTRHGVG
jgi:hypothetical protein